MAATLLDGFAWKRLRTRHCSPPTKLAQVLVDDGTAYQRR